LLERILGTVTAPRIAPSQDAAPAAPVAVVAAAGEGQ
jgi:hypothetical protein